MVLVLLDLLLELVCGNLLVLNNQVDLQLLDTEADGDELAGTPGKTVLLDSENVGLERIKVGLVVYYELACFLNTRIIQAYPMASRP